MMDILNADTLNIETMVAETLKDWGIPGAGVSVYSGEKSYAKGFGLATVGTNEKADSDTVFGLGSTTKAFTALAMGMLVDEGKVNWDDLLRKHLPWFQLEDEWVAAHATIRDVMCHRMGLERAQRIYYHGGYSQRQLAERMRYLKTERGFRASFAYTNQNFGLAGLIIEAASGMSWDDFVTTRIFKPLGMTRTGSGWNVVASWPNLASPHAVVHDSLPAGVRMLGDFRPVARFDLSHEPAGSIHSTAADLARWVAFLSGGGAPLVKPETFAEILSPQNIMHDLGQSELAPLWYLQPGINFWTYALGWWALDYRGEKILMHGGQMPGFNAIVAFLPGRKAGFSVTLNVHQTLAHAALFFSLADTIIGGEPKRNWSGQFRDVARGYISEVAAAEEKSNAALPKDRSPAKPLSAYAGSFENKLYGNLVVTLSDGLLRLAYGKSTGVLEPLGGDRWLIRWDYAGIIEDCAISYGDAGSSIFLEHDQATYLRN